MTKLNIDKTINAIRDKVENSESITYSEAIALIQQRINHLLSNYLAKDSREDFYRNFYTEMLEIASIATLSIESNN